MINISESFQPEAQETANILICASQSKGKACSKTILEVFENSLVTLVTQPQDILNLLNAHDFQLLVLDLDVLESKAVAIIETVRRHYSTLDLPILLVLGIQSAAKLKKALAAGANDYLTDPFDNIEVSIRIKNLLALTSFYKINQRFCETLEQKVINRTAKLDMLINSGLMMSMERDYSRLLRYIVTEGQRLLHCEGGTLYLLTPQQTLRFAVRSKGDELPFDEIPLFTADGTQPNDGYASTYAAIHKQTVLIDNVYEESTFDWSGTRSFDDKSLSRTVSILTVPMKLCNSKVIGVLQFFNAKNPETDEITAFSPDIVTFIEALASQASIALDHFNLVEGQKSTTENVIRVIATAIDAKNQHTGRHCMRVPELAEMLAKAACDEKQGVLADFNFKNSDEWFEFRVGAWLHDCGKITTPECLIDKATKLDVLYNRIHEIRTRFEVLLRDCEINRLETLLNGGDPQMAAELFDRQKRQLLDDFAFIAECNLGSELMDEAHLERIMNIATRTWQRHFDNRLGITYDESLLHSSATSQTLPVTEYLLADKPSHIIERIPNSIASEQFGLKVAIPEYQYNYGEIYNLSVRKGTLTTEDRFKINEHIIETIRMLEQLPWPEYLKRVPEYATTHHETMDGSGYPRQLNAEQLSIPARIMAIADIFEALTATDRPYKKPNKLSESIQILYDMKVNQKIDADLFELLLRSGVYERYAQQFLDPEQIDAVDIERFLA